MHRPALLLLGACLTATVQAETMRCGNSFVDEGYSTQALVGRCGPPTDLTNVPALVNTETYIDATSARPYTVQSVQRPAYQVWYYDFGHNRLVASIIVMNGAIVQIRKGGDGH